MDAVGLLEPRPATLYKVELPVDPEDATQLELYQAWLWLWCKSHCKGRWTLNHNNSFSSPIITAEFERQDDAFTFRMIAPSLL